MSKRDVRTVENPKASGMLATILGVVALTFGTLSFTTWWQSILIVLGAMWIGRGEVLCREAQRIEEAEKALEVEALRKAGLR